MSKSGSPNNPIPKTGDHGHFLPKKLGPYEIEGWIERNAHHEIYRGFNKDYRPIFIKQLAPHLAKDSECKERFLNEIELLQELNHPNIVEILYVNKNEAPYFFACEYIEGLSLRDFLLQSQPSTQESLNILQQMSSAVDDMHAKGIIHRDLKPENVLITADREIKIVDFSISQRAGQLPRKSAHPHNLTGTLLYMSPEQQKNAPLDKNTDLYSFAIIAYELISGHLSHGMIQLGLLPPPIQAIFAKALQTEPSLRFETATQFIETLIKEHRRLSYSQPFPKHARIARRTLLMKNLEKDLGNQLIVRHAYETPSSFIPPLVFWQSYTSQDGGVFWVYLEGAANSIEDTAALHYLKGYLDLQMAIKEMSLKDLIQDINVRLATLNLKISVDGAFFWVKPQKKEMELAVFGNLYLAQVLNQPFEAPVQLFTLGEAAYFEPRVETYPIENEQRWMLLSRHRPKPKDSRTFLKKWLNKINLIEPEAFACFVSRNLTDLFLQAQKKARPVATATTPIRGACGTVCLDISTA